MLHHKCPPPCPRQYQETLQLRLLLHALRANTLFLVRAILALQALIRGLVPLYAPSLQRGLQCLHPEPPLMLLVLQATSHRQLDLHHALKFLQALIQTTVPLLVLLQLYLARRAIIPALRALLPVPSCHQDRILMQLQDLRVTLLAQQTRFLLVASLFARLAHLRNMRPLVQRLAYRPSLLQVCHLNRPHPYPELPQLLQSQVALVASTLKRHPLLQLASLVLPEHTHSQVQQAAVHQLLQEPTSRPMD